MTGGGIDVKKTDTIVDELERLHEVVRQRAYDLSRSGGASGGPMADWLAAERELVSKPAVELRQTHGHFHVLVALPGVDAKDLEVRITPDDLLIKAETRHEHRTDTVAVHACEFDSGTIFRSIHFPETVNPNSAKAEFRNGLLHLTAAVAKAGAAKRKGKTKTV